MSPPPERQRWIVRGRVQGVGFRWFVWREAERLGLAGFARNLRDGTVEVVCEGPETSLEALERAIARGPAGARVEAVDRAQVPAEQQLPKSFEIQ